MQITRNKNNKKVYTLILIPGKYGKSRTLNITPWFLHGIAFILITSTILTFLILFKYIKIRETDLTYKEKLKYQNTTVDNQQKELDRLKNQEDELINKLEEINSLEEQLKKQLKNNTNDKNSTSIIIDRTKLISSADAEISKLYNLLTELDKVTISNSKLPHILPCQGTLTSYFGGRTSPTSRGRREFHTGIDIANSYRTPVRSAANGIVEYSGWLARYGNTVIIDHQNGYTTLYGHNSKLLVKKGDKVKTGQTISLMGSTGRSTGTHVHFEIRFNNSVINPLKFIRGGK